MRSILRWLGLPRHHHKHKEELMEHFSEEYLARLVNEHKLVSTTITHLTSQGIYTQKARQHGIDAMTLCVSNLKAKKVELEGMIDVLTEFLRS
jgi:hypothetical protein